MNKITQIKIFLLLCFSVVLAVFLYNETYITSLISYHGADSYISYTDNPLTHGVIIRGNITAGYNNLGIISFHINTFNRLNNNTLVFRLKEQGNIDWFVVNSYVTDRFVSGESYPFGFPPITDSKGKTYEFELYSENGRPDNSIGILPGYGGPASHYVFTRSELISDNQLGIQFIFEKIRNLFSDIHFLIFLTIFIIPGWYLFVSKDTKKNSHLQTVGVFVGLYSGLVYIFIPATIRSETIFIIAVAIAGMCVRARIPAASLFLGSLFYLLLIPLTIFVGNFRAANNAAVIVFFTLVSAVILSALKVRLYHKEI